MVEPLKVLLIPFALAIALCALLLRSSWARRLSDHPNERSLHRHPTPRIGGIAIVLASMPLATMLTTPELDWPFALALGLALVSFADDLRSLPIAVRLPVHFAAAALVIASLASKAPAMPLAVT